MKILYLHGLDSSPNEAKLRILQHAGHQTVAPFSDYRKEKDVYSKLRRIALEERVEHIVASSLGGYFGYWLGHELRIDQLLFNPAMPYRSIRVQSLDIDERPDVKSWVVLGAHDEVILPKLNLDFFASREGSRIVTCEWLGHRIDLETFEEMTRWCGLSEYEEVED